MLEQLMLGPVSAGYKLIGSPVVVTKLQRLMLLDLGLSLALAVAARLSNR